MSSGKHTQNNPQLLLLLLYVCVCMRLIEYHGHVLDLKVHTERTPIDRVGERQLQGRTATL